MPNDHFCFTHRITVRSLSEGTNIPALAAEIVDKCKLIHPSKVRADVCCRLPCSCQGW